MKVCYQPTLATPGDWLECDSADWDQLDKRPKPVGGEDINHAKGYIHRVCIQGMSGSGDHYAVKHLGDDCQLITWTDDFEDEQEHPRWKPTDPKEWWYFAHVIHFRPLAPDPELGGAINTNITRTLFGGKRILEEWKLNGPVKNMDFQPFSKFVKPRTGLVRHGIWVPDELDLLHGSKLSLGDWRNWGQHLEPNELDENGLLKPQHEQGRFAPKQGTITYFQRDTDRASGVHATVDITHENELNSSAGASETEVSSNYTVGTDKLEFLFTTASGQPNDADWPNGAYECQLDITNFDTNITCGLLTLGGSAGHFANVDSGLTTDNETWTQTQAAFGTAGLNLASRTLDPASGAAGDRFECLIAGARSAGCHGNRTFTLRYSSDAFARGPWTPAAGAPRQMDHLAMGHQ